MHCTKPLIILACATTVALLLIALSQYHADDDIVSSTLYARGQSRNVIIAVALGVKHPDYTRPLICSWAAHASNNSEMHILVGRKMLNKFTNFYKKGGFCARSGLHFIVTAFPPQSSWLRDHGFTIIDTHLPAINRYYLYLEHVASLEDIDNIMLIDSRDSLIQREPFALLAPVYKNGMMASMENILFGNEVWNDKWVRVLFGEDLLRKFIAEKEFVICSGLTMGSAKTMRLYLEIMLKRFSPLMIDLYGADQGVHNVVLRDPAIAPLLQRPPCEQSQLMTAGFFTRSGAAPPGSMKWTNGIFVRTWNHTTDTPAVLHQYDRLAPTVAPAVARFYHKYQQANVLTTTEEITVSN